MIKYKKVIIDQFPFKNLDTERRWSLRGRWPCHWISGAANSKSPVGIAYSNHFSLKQAEKFLIHVTADQRYELFLDGKLISRGPERGSPNSWFYETYEIELETGQHNFTALVWSYGKWTPYAQMTIRHGFMLAADNEMGALLNTGSANWQTQKITGMRFLIPKLTMTGPEYEIDGAKFPWGIERGGLKNPKNATILEHGLDVSSTNEYHPNYLLTPATLPTQLQQKITTAKIRYVSEQLNGKINFDTTISSEVSIWEQLLQGSQITVQPNQTRRIIIDFADYYCGYPVLTVSKGQGAKIEISWAEALFTENKPFSPKLCRDELDNRYFIGIKDRFLPNGTSSRKYTIPWWRSGRYIEISITTGIEILTLEALDFIETRYPLTNTGCFTTDNAAINAIPRVALRTLQMCLHETYMDCPYYEQLMYLGDTRIQILTNFTIASDSRPSRKAIKLITDSIMPNGLTQSRYPSRITQVIPPFSLWWVAMVYDYALWRGDPDFIRTLLPTVRYVLDSFSKYLNKDGLLEKLPNWNFVDWTPEWRQNDGAGVPPEAEFGISGVINWQYVYTLSLTAELHVMLEDNDYAAIYHAKGQQLAKKLTDFFYDEQYELFADTLDKKHFSEHTQCLAILSGYLDDSLKFKVGEALLKAQNLTRTTVYFSHYLFETYSAIQADNAFFDRLEPWLTIEELGLKTLVEEPEPSRSDCHAWSAHPLYHLYTTVAGIRPGAFGFKQVKIRPMLGTLKKLDVEIVHPAGKIKLYYNKKSNGKFIVKITLPQTVAGELVINHHTYPLSPGENSFNLNSD
ncbi:MAG: hypothetical protein L3J71_14465 [Victivallaceae bacterium]|nr:hypothetical protein [Victivallaceae bacterium]